MFRIGLTLAIASLFSGIGYFGCLEVSADFRRMIEREPYRETGVSKKSLLTLDEIIRIRKKVQRVLDL